MDPAFWNNLPAIIAAVVGGLATILGSLATIIGLLLRRDIKENTKVTVEAKETVVNKVASATKEVNDQTTLVAKAATTVAARSATLTASASAAMMEQTKAIAEKTDRIEDSINGRMSSKLELTAREAHARGLLEGSELLSRVASNSQRIDVLEKRIENVESNTNRILEIIERK